MESVLALPQSNTKARLVDKPILVVGKSGQLATCLRDVAYQKNISLVCLGRPDIDLESGAGIEETIAAIAPSAIINAAAYTAVDQAESEPARACAINRDGAARLAAAVSERNIPFIHISTDYVFDGYKQSAYHENDKPEPLNVYGRSKLEGEIAVLNENPQALVIRTSWIYSPYGNNFVRTMLRLSTTQSVVRVVNDQKGTPTSAADLAAAILEIVHKVRTHPKSDMSGIYHLAGQGEVTWNGFATAIFASLVSRKQPVPKLRSILTEEYPTPARRPKNSCLDSSRAERIFQIRLAPWQTSLESCLDQLIMQMELPAC